MQLSQQKAKCAELQGVLPVKRLGSMTSESFVGDNLLAELQALENSRKSIPFEDSQKSIQIEDTRKSIDSLSKIIQEEPLFTQVTPIVGVTSITPGVVTPGVDSPGHIIQTFEEVVMKQKEQKPKKEVRSRSAVSRAQSVEWQIKEHQRYIEAKQKRVCGCLG